MRTRRLLPDAAHDALARCDDFGRGFRCDLTRVTWPTLVQKSAPAFKLKPPKILVVPGPPRRVQAIRTTPAHLRPAGSCGSRGAAGLPQLPRGTGTRPRALAVAVLAPWPEMLGAAASLPGGRRPAVRADGTPSGVGQREWAMATRVAEYKDTTTTRPWRRRALSVDRAPPYAPYAIAPKAVARATRTAHVDRIARTARRARRRAH